MGFSSPCQHIREQERHRREAEETRKGREHLDALLDQSGQILETQHLDLSRGNRLRSRSSSLSTDLEGEEDRETDVEEDVPSGDDASSAGDDSDLGQEVPSDGVEEVDQSVASGDSDDDEETSAAALLGLDASAVLPDGAAPSSENAEGDVEMVEEAGDGTPLAEEISATPFDGGSSPHSDLLATPSTDPLLASPRSLGPTPRPIVLSPPPDLSTHALPPATHPFNEVLLTAEQTFYPVCKVPAAESEVTDIPAESLTPDRDVAHEVHLSQEKPMAANEDITMATSDEMPQSTPVTYDSETDFPPNGASLSISGVEGGTPLAEDDDAASAIGEELEEDRRIPRYLKPYAVAPVEWDTAAVIKPPALLRGILRPYQQAGLEWLASIHTRNLNCILADEMGLGCVFSFSFVSHSLTHFPARPFRPLLSWPI